MKKIFFILCGFVLLAGACHAYFDEMDNKLRATGPFVDPSDPSGRRKTIIACNMAPKNGVLINLANTEVNGVLTSETGAEGLGPYAKFRGNLANVIIFGDNESLVITTEATWAFAFRRLKDTSGSNPVFSKYVVGNYEFICGWLNGGGAFYAWIYDAVSAGYRGRTALKEVIPINNKWVIMMVRYHPITGMEIWRGDPVSWSRIDTANFSAGLFTTVRNGTAALKIGGQSEGLELGATAGFFDMAWFQMWNYAIDDVAAKGLYNKYLRALANSGEDFSPEELWP